MFVRIARRSSIAAMILASVVVVAGYVTEAEAQPTCVPRPQLVKLLKSAHGELPVSIGLGANGSVFELFSSGEGNTWTLVMTKPNGYSCLIMSGENWTPIAPVSGQIS